ncbi:MAG: hypothetical protein P1U70_22990, partial [Saprospiraceae bacterium]|nr:hypothetical protein [Saprospiraceae bacterium]
IDRKSEEDINHIISLQAALSGCQQDSRELEQRIIQVRIKKDEYKAQYIHYSQQVSDLTDLIDKMGKLLESSEESYEAQLRAMEEKYTQIINDWHKFYEDKNIKPSKDNKIIEQMKKLKDTITGYAEKVKYLQGEVDAWKAQGKVSEEMLNKLLYDNDIEPVDISDLGGNNLLRDAIYPPSGGSDVKEHSENMVDLRDRIADLIGRYKDKLEQCEEKLEKLPESFREEIKSLQEAKAMLKTKIAELESNLKDANDKHTNCEQKISKLNQLIADGETSIEELKQKYAKLLKDIKDEFPDVKSNDAIIIKMRALKDQLAIKDNIIIKLRTQITELTNRIKDLMTKMSGMQSELEGKIGEEEISAMTTKIQALKNMLENCRSENNQLKRTLADQAGDNEKKKELTDQLKKNEDDINSELAKWSEYVQLTNKIYGKMVKKYDPIIDVYNSRMEELYDTLKRHENSKDMELDTLNNINNEMDAILNQYNTISGGMDNPLADALSELTSIFGRDSEDESDDEEDAGFIAAKDPNAKDPIIIANTGAELATKMDGMLGKISETLNNMQLSAIIDSENKNIGEDGDVWEGEPEEKSPSPISSPEEEADAKKKREEAKKIKDAEKEKAMAKFKEKIKAFAAVFKNRTDVATNAEADKDEAEAAKAKAEAAKTKAEAAKTKAEADKAKAEADAKALKDAMDDQRKKMQAALNAIKNNSNEDIANANAAAADAVAAANAARDALEEAERATANKIIAAADAKAIDDETIAALENKISTCSDCTTTLEDMRLQLNACKNELAELKDSKNQDDFIPGLGELSYDDLLAENKQLQDQLDQLPNSDIANELKDANATNTGLLQKLTLAEAELNKLRNKMNEEKSSNNNKFIDLESTITLLQEQLNTMTARYIAARQSNADLHARIIALNANMATDDNTIDDDNKTLDDIKAKYLENLEDLDHLNINLAKENNDLREKIKAVKAELQETEDQLAEMARRVRELYTENKENKTNLDDCNAAVVRVTVDRDAANVAATTAANNLATANATITARDAQLAAQAAALAAAPNAAALLAMQQEIADLKQQLASAQSTPTGDDTVYESRPETDPHAKRLKQMQTVSDDLNLYRKKKKAKKISPPELKDEASMLQYVADLRKGLKPDKHGHKGGHTFSSSPRWYKLLMLREDGVSGSDFNLARTKKHNSELDIMWQSRHT